SVPFGRVVVAYSIMEGIYSGRINMWGLGGYVVKYQKDTYLCSPEVLKGHAQMAKLVDALCSGRSARKGVLVRIQFWAPINKRSTKVLRFFYAQNFVIVLLAAGAAFILGLSEDA